MGQTRISQVRPPSRLPQLTVAQTQPSYILVAVKKALSCIISVYLYETQTNSIYIYIHTYCYIQIKGARNINKTRLPKVCNMRLTEAVTFELMMSFISKLIIQETFGTNLLYISVSFLQFPMWYPHAPFRNDGSYFLSNCF